MELTREQNLTEDQIAEFIKTAYQMLTGHDKYKMMDYILNSPYRIEPSPTPVVSGERPYFKLSRNEYGKAWLFYKPSEEAFEELLKASTASVAVERPVEGGTEGKEYGATE